MNRIKAGDIGLYQQLIKCIPTKCVSTRTHLRATVNEAKYIVKLRLKLVFANKDNPDGTLKTKYKGLLVVAGCSQVEGVDYM